MSNTNTTSNKVLSFNRFLLTITLFFNLLLTPAAVSATTLGGVDLGNLPNYLFVFTNSYEDANLQAATKGFLGDIAVDGIDADERTSGTTAFSGTLYTNGLTQDAWQKIVDDNPSQSTGVTGDNVRIAGLEADLVRAIQQINALSPTPGYESVSSLSLNGLNTQNGTAETFVINITSKLDFKDKINITGDAGDIFFLRWDEDGDPTNGYLGMTKPASGGAIVPKGDLKPTNFINVAGDINSASGGINPPAPYPQGPRYGDGQGPLITGGSDFSGGGFFTGYWLTTGKPDHYDPVSGLYYGKTSPHSNGIFVGGWYTLDTSFSITGGTSGVHISPPVSSTTPIDLSCSTGYKLETWPTSAPDSTTFDSNNSLLRLTASKNFTNSTHPGIGGIYTSASNSKISETLTISTINPSVTSIEKFRVLVYDLDSKTNNYQDYAYITFNNNNVAASSLGANVALHPSIPNAYTAKLNSGESSGADDPYHAGFVIDGITDGSILTLTSGYTGTGSESFVGYQACVLTSGSSITGNVFKDANTNDVFDKGETGIANISLWLQTINADGLIDPVKVSVVTDALGKYQLSGLADGNYQLYIDTADKDLPKDHSLGVVNPQLITIKGTDITNANFSFDEVACSAFTGEVNEVALPLSSQLNTSDKLFVPSKSVAPNINGHLRAYAIDDNGVTAKTASWDAGARMSAANRSSNLYSTDASGSKIAFNSLDEAAFNSSTFATIKAYTIDPSTAAGIYLAGRESGSFLGGISKGNELDILSNKINTSLYLSDKTYRSYYSGTVATRAQHILMSSDDGFLYAFDSTTGDLVWGWMPRTIVSDLVDYTNFQSKHLMAGSVDVLDLADGSGNYASYIVGSYKGGLGHYVLKLGADGSLDSVVWDDDQSSSFNKSPNNGEMEFFRDGSGKTYAAYILANDTTATTSRLKIKSLTDSSKDMSVDLNYQASSTPFVMQDYDNKNAPAKKTLYLGTTNGDIHAAKVLASDGSLESASDIQTSLQATKVARMVDDSDTSDAVLYINTSVSAKDGLYYLSSQTATRLTLHRYNAADTSWNKAWTSYSSGAGKWVSGTYTADTSGVPSADTDGFNIIPPTGIQSLPADATITAKAVIVGDAVVLPLSVLAKGSSACYGKAYYYLYSLSDGTFPSKTFFNNDGTNIETDIALGYGEAKQLSITDMAGTNKLLGYGMTDKKTDLSSGIAKSFVIKDIVTSGIRGWKEIGR